MVVSDDLKFKLIVAGVGLAVVMYAAKKNGGLLKAAETGFNTVDGAVTSTALDVLNNATGANLNTLDPAQLGYQAGDATRQFVVNLGSAVWDGMQHVADDRLIQTTQQQSVTSPFPTSPWDVVPMGL